jgi:hypothetical protein
MPERKSPAGSFRMQVLFADPDHSGSAGRPGFTGRVWRSSVRAWRENYSPADDNDTILGMLRTSSEMTLFLRVAQFQIIGDYE